MNAIDLMEWILVIVGVLFIIIMVLIIIAMVANVVTFEKEKTVEEEEEKKDYLVHITFKEQVLGGSHTTKLIYVKATSPKEALKRAEEYYMEHCSIPALKSLYEKGEIVIIARCIDDCAIVW